MEEEHFSVQTAKNEDSANTETYGIFLRRYLACSQCNKMILEKIFLQNFRNYESQLFEFSSQTTLLVGPNSIGKTNALEAIFLLATGTSFRSNLDEEMIEYDKEIARVKGQLKAKGKENLEIILTRGEVAGKKTHKKHYFLNSVKKRKQDFVGRLSCVFFGPDDLKIIINSPSTRREYLDQVLEQASWEYRRANLSYQKTLRQRNRLLEQIREREKPVSSLFFWDKLLIENGEKITYKREEFIDFVNGQPDYFGDLEIAYEKSIVSPERLKKYQQKEIASAMTLVGPHRDDFIISQVNGEKIRDLHKFGSRGEQRTAIFSLKLSELEYLSRELSKRPVLLLDDIFSELDHERRIRLLEVIPKQQTIITTADIHMVEKEKRDEMKIIRLS